MSQVLLSLPQVAKRCGVSLTTVHKWIRGIAVAGVRVRLHARTYGTRSKVTEGALEDFLASCDHAKYGDVGEQHYRDSAAQSEHDEREYQRALQLVNS